MGEGAFYQVTYHTSSTFKRKEHLLFSCLALLLAFGMSSHPAFPPLVYSCIVMLHPHVRYMHVKPTQHFGTCITRICVLDICISAVAVNANPYIYRMWTSVTRTRRPSATRLDNRRLSPLQPGRRSRRSPPGTRMGGRRRSSSRRS